MLPYMDFISIFGFPLVAIDFLFHNELILTLIAS